MTDDDLTLEDVRRMAADIGMTRLDADQLQALLRATRLARGRRAALGSVPLEPADEPAHVYRPGEDAQ